MPLSLQDDFDSHSWDGVEKCSVCNVPKLPRHIGVFRHPIEDDFRGSPDICEDCIREAAGVVGLVSPEDHTALQKAFAVQEQEITTLRTLLREARESQASLARENVRLQDELEGQLELDLEEYLEAEDAD